MTEPVLLDTHALIWWVAEPRRLSASAENAIEGASAVLVSAASAWELALLVDAGRVAIDRPVEVWLSDVGRRRSVRAVPIDAEVATAAVALGRRGFHRDPADRFLYATAVREGVPLVSRDAAISSFAKRDRRVRVLW